LTSFRIRPVLSPHQPNQLVTSVPLSPPSAAWGCRIRFLFSFVTGCKVNVFSFQGRRAASKRDCCTPFLFFLLHAIGRSSPILKKYVVLSDSSRICGWIDLFSPPPFSPNRQMLFLSRGISIPHLLQSLLNIEAGGNQRERKPLPGAARVEGGHDFLSRKRYKRFTFHSCKKTRLPTPPSKPITENFSSSFLP